MPCARQPLVHLEGNEWPARATGDKFERQVMLAQRRRAEVLVKPEFGSGSRRPHLSSAGAAGWLNGWLAELTVPKPGSSCSASHKAMSVWLGMPKSEISRTPLRPVDRRRQLLPHTLAHRRSPPGDLVREEWALLLIELQKKRCLPSFRHSRPIKRL
jgi:hypothetical protein